MSHLIIYFDKPFIPLKVEWNGSVLFCYHKTRFKMDLPQFCAFKRPLFLNFASNFPYRPLIIPPFLQYFMPLIYSCWNPLNGNFSKLWYFSAICQVQGFIQAFWLMSVLWKKIEFYKGKSSCKVIVIAAWIWGRAFVGFQW